MRGNTLASRVGSNILAAVLGIVIVSFFLSSCGGSGGTGDRETSVTAVFPPVVFMADNDTSGTIELYASFDDGTDIIKLSGTMVFGGNVVDFKVSPNGIWVAYVADQDTNDVFELYVVPVDKTAGEEAVKISGDPMAGDGVKETDTGRYAFEWASDNSRVAYLADQDTPDVIELYSNVPEGTSLFLLSVLPGGDRDVEDFAWSPKLNTHRLIAYRADQQTLDVIELFTTRPDSSLSQKISSGVGFGSNVTAFKWAPDAQRIAFTADKNIGIFDLYTTFPTFINDIHVSGSLAVTSDVINFKWSPNSVQLAYLVLTATPDFQLMTTPNDSLASISISSDIEDEAESNYGWSWDSSLIAFIAGEDTADEFELFTSEPVNVSTKTKVSGDFLVDGDVDAFKWAPTELLIAYTADQVINDKIELYTTNPPPAVTVTKVSGTPFAGVAVEDDFQWSPDSSLIAYRADQDTLDQIELYSTDPDGLDNNTVSGILPSDGDVDEFQWDDLGTAIGYLANQISVTVIELFASEPDGAENTRLSSDLVDENGDPEADGNVSAFEWVPEI
jgi:Tol biopolymer transport system component